MDSKGSIFFSIKPCLITIAFAPSSCSYTIGLSYTTAHNIAPRVYTAVGYTGVNNFMIHFHMPIAKPQLHKQCLAVSIRSVQKGHILSTFPFRHPLTGIALWTNNHQKQTIFLLIFIPHSHFQNCLRCCGESPFRLQTTFVVGSFHDLAPNIFLPIFPKYWKKGTYLTWSCIHAFQYSSSGS